MPYLCEFIHRRGRYYEVVGSQVKLLILCCPAIVEWIHTICQTCPTNETRWQMTERERPMSVLQFLHNLPSLSGQCNQYIQRNTDRQISLYKPHSWLMPFRTVISAMMFCQGPDKGHTELSLMPQSSLLLHSSYYSI